MPKKAVATFLLLALLGAAIFVFFTFPRTKDEIPTSNNQHPFPSAPVTPDGVPVPETVPHPSQTPPRGPTLHVMAWASPAETKVLEAEADAFEASTGNRVSLTIGDDEAAYRHDLPQALASPEPPDVCLINASDFSGIDPSRDLLDVTPTSDLVPRGVSAFTFVGRVKALPDEFSVDMLFYNPAYFDQAAIGYPDRHWNWDILEAIARGLASLKLHDSTGQPIYPLEVSPDFDLWNVFCSQAGHPALELDTWHLADAGSRDAHVRALDFIHTIFQGLSITAPLPKAGQPAGRYFAQQQAALLIAPSERSISFSNFPWRITFLPCDMARASVARVNGWAVSAQSSYPQAAQSLAAFLARRPIHAGWSSAQVTSETDTPLAITQEALEQAVLPRIEPRTAPLVQYLDRQIGQLARTPEQDADALYAQISSQYQSGFAPQSVSGSLPAAAGVTPRVSAQAPQLRGL